MATLPSSPKPRRADCRRVYAQARARSPFTFQRQTQVYSGKLWKIVLEFPPIKESAVAAWHQFFEDMNGLQGTFTFDLNTYVKSTPAPGTVTFEFPDGATEQGWSIERARLYGIVIEAIQVPS
jgi:hypothetical protein